jgi:hypothetical protein
MKMILSSYIVHAWGKCCCEYIHCHYTRFPDRFAIDKKYDLHILFSLRRLEMERVIHLV